MNAVCPTHKEPAASADERIRSAREVFVSHPQAALRRALAELLIAGASLHFRGLRRGLRLDARSLFQVRVAFPSIPSVLSSNGCWPHELGSIRTRDSQTASAAQLPAELGVARGIEPPPPPGGGGRQGLTKIGGNFLEPVSALTWPKTRQNMPTQSAPTAAAGAPPFMPHAASPAPAPTGRGTSAS
jgi:hypothetical protein